MLFSLVQPEHEHGHLILQAHDRRCQVNCRQLLVDHLLDRDLVVLQLPPDSPSGRCRRSRRWPSPEASRPPRSRTALKTAPVSVEKYGCPVPPAKKITLPCLQRFHCRVLGKQGCERPAHKRGEHFGLHPHVTEDVRYINTVHHCRQHPDLVCLCPVDRLAGPPSPEVAAPGHDRHLDAVVDQLLLTCSATPMQVASSNPVFLSPASASPLSFSSTLFIVSAPLISPRGTAGQPSAPADLK